MTQEAAFRTVLGKVRGMAIEKMAWPVLALDPGEGTTGWAVFNNGDLAAAGQVSGAATEIENLVECWSPAIVVAEEYRVYGWKAKQHSWSDIPTLQLIGAMRYICEKKNIPCHLQSAQVAKGFATDEKLRGWDLWQTSARHANDAIRHAVYFLLCNKAGPKRR